MQRTYPDRPLVGVGAIIIHDYKVLIVQRGKEPRKGEWTVPGGMLEVGETLRSGVEREVLEETGLTVKVGEVVDVVDSIYRDADSRIEYHYVIIDYLCELTGGTLTVGSDISDARWISRGEVDRMPLIGRTAEVIGKAFK